MGQPEVNITIRREQPSDFKTIGTIVQKSFADLAISDHTEHLLVDRLRRSDAYIPELALVAESNGTLCGYILVTRVFAITDGHSHELLSVAPLSVLPEFQRRGIGGRLIIAAHDEARRLGYHGIVLIGHQEYYPRFGYVKASAFGISFPFEAPDSNCMAVELYAGALDGIRGTIKYPDEFFSSEE